MSQATQLITQDKIAAFVEANLITPVNDIAVARESIIAMSEIARSTMLLAFGSNPHYGYRNLVNFDPSLALVNQKENKPTNDIVVEIHKEVWVKLSDLVKDLSPVTQYYFKNTYIRTDSAIRGLGAPNVENINAILTKLEPVHEIALKMAKLKDSFEHLVGGGELQDKVKLKEGSMDEKAKLIADLASIHLELLNHVQPIHHPKITICSADSMLANVQGIINSKVGTESNVTDYCSIKVFANGNIDLRFNWSFTFTYFKMIF